MAEHYARFNEHDVARLKAVLAWFDQSVVNPRLRPDVPPQLYQTPETYIILTPEGGIPAMTETETGTGTLPDNPNSAECRIFQRFAVTDELQDTGFTETVYNLALTAIPGSLFTLATRTREGDLHALVGGGGTAGIAVVWVEDGIPGISEIETGTGSVEVDNPGSALCEVYTREPLADELTATGRFITVYNVSTTAVAGNRFILVGQDAVGDWYVLSGVLDEEVLTGVTVTCVAGVLTTTEERVRVQVP